MIGSTARWWVLGLTVCAASAPNAFAQAPAFRIQPVASTNVAADGELRGVIRDDRGEPLRGVTISVSGRGSSSITATSDRDGRYVVRLSPGSYLVRAYLQGYSSPRPRYVQVAAGARRSWEISLNRAAAEEPSEVLTAGIGGVAGESTTGTAAIERHETSEVEWRMSQAKRGVLKGAYIAAIERSGADADTFNEALRLAVGSSGRFVSLFDGVNGQVNLLTTTSFDRPQDLFDSTAGAPRPVAYVSLVAPLAEGNWAVRGSMTQGDIASWLLAGSFVRNRPDSPHHYEIGLSYAAQRYQGANVEALAAMRGGSRNVGEISADDVWTVVPRLTIATGARYASYDYLKDRFLLGGRLSVAWQVDATDPLRLRVTAVHREMAPGAEEFVAPVGGLWLPPERTFSSMSRSNELRPERVDILELSGERPVGAGVVVAVRAFRQEIEDQIVTLFGGMHGPSTLGHYRVASAGDFENYGWGVMVTRHVLGSTNATIDYTMTDTQRRGATADRGVLRVMAPGALRREERVHDLTASVNSRVAATATRFLVVYKLNSAYADAGSRHAEPGARFDVQVSQEMPFLNFTGANWEMLVGVRNLFRSELFEGSVYDELLVVRPPKRVTGGVTVRF